MGFASDSRSSIDTHGRRSKIRNQEKYWSRESHVDGPRYIDIAAFAEYVSVVVNCSADDRRGDVGDDEMAMGARVVVRRYAMSATGRNRTYGQRPKPNPFSASTLEIDTNAVAAGVIASYAAAFCPETGATLIESRAWGESVYLAVGDEFGAVGVTFPGVRFGHALDALAAGGRYERVAIPPSIAFRHESEIRRPHGLSLATPAQAMRAEAIAREVERCFPIHDGNWAFHNALLSIACWNVLVFATKKKIGVAE